MTTRSGFGLAMMAGAVATLAVSGAMAQAPSQPTTRFIVGAAAGGAIDPYARLVAEHMAKGMGRTIIVENKPGANGNIAAQMIVDAPADGTLVWVGTQSMTEINPNVYANLRWSIGDFVPLIRGVEAPMVLVAHPSVPARTLPELVAWAKSKQGQLSYASFSPGTPSHFLGHQLSQRFGLDMAHVPYRGSGPQTTDLVAGHALVGFAQMSSAVPHSQAGRLNAIATTGRERSRHLPNVPTFAELGYPDFTASIWFGLLVRAGTPAETSDKLLAAARAAHADPKIKASLEEQGFDVSGQTGPDFLADIKAQSGRWAALVKATGFKAD